MREIQFSADAIMKEYYLSAGMEVVTFTQVDVITTSAAQNATTHEWVAPGR